MISYCFKAVRGCNDRFVFVLLLLCLPFYPVLFLLCLPFFGLPQLGVIPFEIRTLKIGHTEQRRTQRFYIAEIVRHRGTVGAWRNRGYLRVLLMFGLFRFKAIVCKVY